MIPKAWCYLFGHKFYFRANCNNFWHSYGCEERVMTKRCERCGRDKADE